MYTHAKKKHFLKLFNRRGRAKANQGPVLPDEMFAKATRIPPGENKSQRQLPVPEPQTKKDADYMMQVMLKSHSD